VVRLLSSLTQGPLALHVKTRETFTPVPCCKHGSDIACGGLRPGLTVASVEHTIERDLLAVLTEPSQQLRHRHIGGDLAAAHDADPVAELLGHVQLVRGQQDGLALLPRQPGDPVPTVRAASTSRPKVGSSSSTIGGWVMRAAAMATFCCMPREKLPTRPRRTSQSPSSWSSHSARGLISWPRSPLSRPK
jgi:hypothetical protein